MITFKIVPTLAFRLPLNTCYMAFDYLYTTCVPKILNAYCKALPDFKKYYIYWGFQQKTIKMKYLTARFENARFIVYEGETIFGEIAIDYKSVEATISIEDITFRAEQEDDDKNIVVKQEGNILFKFKFDYLWGGAEIRMGGKDTGYDVKGRWFKPGTRLTDAEDHDLVVVVTKGELNPELEITVTDTETSHLMILATVYYHIYTSAGKTFGVMMANI